MFENPKRGRQARNFTTNVPKILDLKSSSEHADISENWRWVPLACWGLFLDILNTFYKERWLLRYVLHHLNKV